MCTGACLLFKVKRVVIGENTNFTGGERVLQERGVDVVVLDHEECKELMRTFVEQRPELWSVKNACVADVKSLTNCQRQE